MTATSGLAAAAAAADSVSQADHQTALAAARAEGEKAGRAAGHAEGLTAGAAAERARLAGIDAHAMKGHEVLIAAMKADGSVTPDMAAGRILAAEKKLRDDQMKGIAAVETLTGAVKPAPTASGGEAPKVVEKGTTPEAWKAEFAASATLQAEFASVDDYVAVRKAETSGKSKVFSPAVR